MGRTRPAAPEIGQGAGVVGVVGGSKRSRRGRKTGRGQRGAESATQQPKSRGPKFPHRDKQAGIVGIDPPNQGLRVR